MRCYTERQHIDGGISISEAKELIDSYYESAKSRSEIEDDRTEEAYKVSARIAEKGITETTIYLEQFFPEYAVGGRIYFPQ